MALRVRIKSIVNGPTKGTYVVYSELYDDNDATASIASKQHNYSTSITDEQVLQAVRNAYSGPAIAYVKKLNVKTHIESVISTLVVPTS